MSIQIFLQGTRKWPKFSVLRCFMRPNNELRHSKLAK